MKNLKNISFFLVIAFAMTAIGNFLDSDFLFTYLQTNIIGLLITLLAINTATSGLIASKIQDFVIQKPEIDFSSTIKEMKTSLLEQIILIIISVVCLIIQNSQKIKFDFKDDICNTLLITVFIYAIDILWDTGKAVFVIIEEIQKMKNKEN
ncbi:hypothetical protein [Flavobacterium sp. YO12]|uniref:hypothetical protein n=1 Tax=Flavobacterium sp. YO12 TaxID=1920029 RepID=UPI00100BC4E3|nr:hypothetical protein [Flavobacterium sp. YO12]RXM47115.1 hypothetical protein BOW55_13005 [Flavobacterium sp. YO12]